MQPLEASFNVVNRAFTAQSPQYDAWDQANPVLQRWRRQVYNHVQNFLAPHAHILELNAGTGIDAVYFAKQGHRVLATDLSDGMVGQIQQKAVSNNLPNLTVRQLGFDQLQLLSPGKFDYVFSNFGGLNCIQNLTLISRHLPEYLKPHGFVTWVVMPPFCPWESMGLWKGHWKAAMRRWNKNGTQAHVGGHHFKVFYHSLTAVREALGPSFRLVKCQSLGLVSPPASSHNFIRRHPTLNSLLIEIDRVFAHRFPFNRWGDHLILTFKLNR